MEIISENNIFFPKDAINKILCLCGGKFDVMIEEESVSYIKNATILCGKCHRQFCIDNGILRMYEYIDDDVQVEVKARDIEAYKYDKRLEKRLTTEINPTLSMIGSVKDKDIIEYGCGTGRFTTRLAKNAKTIIASDISLESLRILQNKILDKNLTNIALVHADGVQLNFIENSFDIALSLQVLEHIPHKWQRTKLYNSIYKILRPGGECIHSVYFYDMRQRIRNKSKIGKHSNGIFFRYYTVTELRSELEPYFDKLNISFLDSIFPGLYKFIPQKLIPYFSSILTRIYFFRLFSHLIIVRGVLPEKKEESMKQGVVYLNKSLFFKKQVHWFTQPYMLNNIDHITIFSYQNKKFNGLKKKYGITSIISLDESLEDIWQSFRKKYIQKQIIKGKTKGIEIKIDYNYKDFLKLYYKFRDIKQLAKDHDAVLSLNGFLVSAYYERKMIASGLFIADGVNMRAWVLVSDRFDQSGVMRDLVGQANRMVIWEAIQYAHRNYFNTFDLGGLNTDTASTPERNLNEFKEAFGGKRVESFYYSGTVSKRLKIISKFKKLIR